MPPSRKRKIISILILLLANVSGCEKNIPIAPDAITAMIFNVLYNSKNCDKSVDLIQEHSPDIICLRELTPEFSKLVLNRLGKRYPYQAMHPRQGTWGAGILSKYRVSNAEYFPVKPHRLPGLQAEIHIRSNTLLVSCLHLFPPVGKHLASDTVLTMLMKNEKLRFQQAEYLVGKYKMWRGPSLLLGDMNESRGGGAVQLFIANNYLHACDKALTQRCGASFPAHLNWVPATFEIDHILGKDIRFLTAQVIRSGGSDHYPVQASFQFKKTPDFGPHQR